MKKYKRTLLVLVCVLSAFIIFSCGKKSKKSLEEVAAIENSEDGLKEERISEIMDEFKKITSRKDIDLRETMDFVDENIDLVGRENGDILIYSLEEALIGKAAKNLKAVLAKDKGLELEKLLGDKMFLSDEDLGQLENKDLRSNLEKLYKLNYKILREGKDLKLIVDYSKFLNYNGKISEDADEYLNIKSKLVNIPTEYEGNLNISYEDLGKRLIKIEDYIVHYPQSKRYEDILMAYRENLVDYLKGTDKTPIINEKGIIDNDALNSYKELAKNKDSITGQLIRKYQTNLRVDENFEVRVLSLVNEALSEIEDRVNS